MAKSLIFVNLVVTLAVTRAKSQHQSELSFRQHKERFLQLYKVGYIFPMVVSSEFRRGQYRDDDHQEDAPHFIG